MNKTTQTLLLVGAGLAALWFLLRRGGGVAVGNTTPTQGIGGTLTDIINAVTRNTGTQSQKPAFNFQQTAAQVDNTPALITAAGGALQSLTGLFGKMKTGTTNTTYVPNPVYNASANTGSGSLNLLDAGYNYNPGAAVEGMV